MASVAFCAPLPACFSRPGCFSADPLVGEPYILNSIAVTVIAGTALSGGKGGVLGVIGAAYIFLLISNIPNLLAISTFYQFVAKGVVLILALAVTSSGASLNPARFRQKFFSAPRSELGGETLTWTERKKCSCFFSD